MSSVELLDLPDHVLAKILSYIPDHFVVASVCQKFYELDCINHQNLGMRSNLFGDPDELACDSFQTTNRIFRSINIKFDFKSIEKFKLLKKILQQHGSTAKELKLEEVYDRDSSYFKLKEKELIEILKFFPVLEKLDITLEYIKIVEEDTESSEKSPFLPKLKELAFSSGLMKFFTKNLPENVKNVVENYDFYNINEESTKNLLKVLETRNLEKVQLMNIFEEPRKFSFFTEFLSTQQNLKSHGIVSKYLSEEPDYQAEIRFYNEVVKMKSLEHLTIGEISRAFLEKFPTLNLKSLEICSFDSDYLEDFADELRVLTSATLEKLVLPVSCSPDILQVFELDFPLRSLKFASYYPNVNEVLAKFPLLKSLEMKEEEGSFPDNYTIYSADGQVFENLKHLSIFASSPAICNHNFMEMLKALPNLEKLHFAHVMVYKQKNFFSDLKTNLPKIRELFLTLWIETGDLIDRTTCNDPDCYPSSCSSSEDESLEEKFALTDASIKALQEFSADEKLISFECRIHGLYYKHRKALGALQGFFKCNEDSGTLTLKKGKAMKIPRLDFISY